MICRMFRAYQPAQGLARSPAQSRETVSSCGLELLPLLLQCFVLFAWPVRSQDAEPEEPPRLLRSLSPPWALGKDKCFTPGNNSRDKAALTGQGQATGLCRADLPDNFHRSTISYQWRVHACARVHMFPSTQRHCIGETGGGARRATVRSKTPL